MIEGKIFICDDEEGILRYLKKMLEGKGLAVETFNCGAPLLDRLGSGGEVEFGKYSADIHNNKPCFCLAVNDWHACCRIRVGSAAVAGGQARQALNIGVC